MHRNILARIPFRTYSALFLGASRNALAAGGRPALLHSSSIGKAKVSDAPQSIIEHLAALTKNNPTLHEQMITNPETSEEFKKALAKERSQQGITDEDLLQGVENIHVFRKESKSKSTDSLLEAYPSVEKNGSVPIGSPSSTLFFLGDERNLPSFQEHLKQWINSDGQLDVSAKKGCMAYLMTYQKKIVVVDKSHYTGVDEGVYFKQSDDAIRCVFDFNKEPQMDGLGKKLLDIANTYFEESKYPPWPSQARLASQDDVKTR